MVLQRAQIDVTQDDHASHDASVLHGCGGGAGSIRRVRSKRAPRIATLQVWPPRRSPHRKGMLIESLARLTHREDRSTGTVAKQNVEHAGFSCFCLCCGRSSCCGGQPHIHDGRRHFRRRGDVPDNWQHTICISPRSQGRLLCNSGAFELTWRRRHNKWGRRGSGTVCWCRRGGRWPRAVASLPISLMLLSVPSFCHSLCIPCAASSAYSSLVLNASPHACAPKGSDFPTDS